MKGALLSLKLLLCCAALYAGVARAASPIARFVFTTESQTISVGELSGALTLQAQNAAGEAMQSDETIDIGFSSTSGTGEFLSASGEPVKSTMNKGTANRTFYYRDAGAGTHTLTAVATGRVSGQSWTASQRITVGSAGSPTVPAVAAPAATAIVSSGSVSAAPPTPTIEARAGRDRNAVAGADTVFEGMAIGLLKEPIENARFWWNFGDGSMAEGRTVSHIFRIPGTYMTGLHVSSGMYAASDYVLVNVMPNKVVITEVIGEKDGFVRLRNNSAVAVDIGGWMIEEAGGKKFLLPPHTMIAAGGDVALTHAVTMLTGRMPITVRFPDGSGAFLRQQTPIIPEQTVAPVPALSAVTARSVAGAPTASAKAELISVAPKKLAERENEIFNAGNATSSAHASAAAVGTTGPGYGFLGLAALLSIGASAGFLFLKKFFI